MSITDELRNYAHAFSPTANAKLLEIADRIDAEYEDAVRKKAAKMLTNISEYMDDGDLTDIGLARLPKDADGVLVRVGDRMIDAEGNQFTVDSVDFGRHRVVHEGEAWMLWGDGADFFELAVTCRHHHAPTTEDVLCEMLEKAVGYSDAHTTVALNAIAEYAKRLQLKEVDE